MLIDMNAIDVPENNPISPSIVFVESSRQDAETTLDCSSQQKPEENQSEVGQVGPPPQTSIPFDNDPPIILNPASASESQTSQETGPKIQDIPNLKSKPPEVNDKKKENDKLSIYKALAIKLKKELVKCRDELQTLKEESQQECNNLKQMIKVLEENIELEKQTSSTSVTTLEAKLKSLKGCLEVSELDLQSLQNEFESYKVRATRIMHESNPLQSQSNKSIEEQRFKQLKELNETQSKHIANIELRLAAILKQNQELESKSERYQEQLSSYQTKLESMKNLEIKCETLSRENETLRLALKQFRTKLKEPATSENTLLSCEHSQRINYDRTISDRSVEEAKTPYNTDTTTLTVKDDSITNSNNALPQLRESNSTRLSPSTSVKDESQTTSSSSYDGSTSGYVHIKPATFEIISRSSVLEDAQNQIDNLTKAYLDSENTNSLLSEQVRALKEEIRRLQLITERIELADNLEYLKNVVFKFLSLEPNQTQQKQRLVPVLSTVLKLLPEETAKLNSIATTDKTSMASSFFKL